MQALANSLKTLAKTDTAAIVKFEELFLKSLTGNKEKTSFLQVVNHFARENIGSKDFWTSVDTELLNKFNQLSRNEIQELAESLIESDYELSDKLDRRLGHAIFSAASAQVDRELQRDPYIVKKAEALFRRTFADNEGENEEALENAAQQVTSPNFKSYAVKTPNEFEGEGKEEEVDKAQFQQEIDALVDEFASLNQNRNASTKK
eukprot:TRINITY_DN2331_c0_g1_i1.p1 TRINITY_DN2331_c0_g1~~TRINITY_DN2331_c0_g1_i1.p1  ORF type:complete len:205 (+),score=64.48 TRINITY_DN2331_c0_g1_i1:126-740(+)